MISIRSKIWFVLRCNGELIALSHIRVGAIEQMSDEFASYVHGSATEVCFRSFLGSRYHIVSRFRVSVMSSSERDCLQPFVARVSLLYNRRHGVVTSNEAEFRAYSLATSSFDDLADDLRKVPSRLLEDASIRLVIDAQVSVNDGDWMRFFSFIR